MKFSITPCQEIQARINNIKSELKDAEIRHAQIVDRYQRSQDNMTMLKELLDSLGEALTILSAAGK